MNQQEIRDFYCDQALTGKLQLEVLEETSYILAFKHTNPYFQVHIVVIPKAHVESIDVLLPEHDPMILDAMHVISHRGRAVGEFLIRELSRRGCSELRVDDCSLFVLESNTPAVRLYSRLGFRAEVYVGEAPSIEGCVYMVATTEQINAKSVVTQQAVTASREEPGDWAKETRLD